MRQTRSDQVASAQGLQRESPSYVSLTLARENPFITVSFKAYTYLLGLPFGAGLDIVSGYCLKERKRKKKKKGKNRFSGK